MKNSFFQQFQQNIESLKKTIKTALIGDEKSQNKQVKQNSQLNLQDILTEKQQKRNSQQQKISQQERNNKIKNAFTNSSIAKMVYHHQQPQKYAQKLIQHSQVLKQIQKQISFASCSRILQLKVQQQKEQDIEQMRGILMKFSPSFFGGWSDRLCVLTKNKFTYFQGKTQQTIGGILNFNLLSFSIVQKIQNHTIQSFEIKVDKGQKSFIFKGFNSKQTLQWFEKIKILIDKSEGKIKNVTSLSNYHRFWRKDYISQKQFIKCAKTGDLLLFRGKKSSAIFQRKVTGQEYDHIGMILLNAFNQILVFEANGGFGVGICPWKKFIKNKWYEDQQIVVVRHLKIKRTEQLLSEIQKFVEQNIGKQYKFSLKNYIMSRYSTIQNQKESYFCSSLISKLYKKLGLLDPNISSNRYMPYDYSQKQNMKLLTGKYGEAKLDKQKIIVF